ncbi:hypothetical protein H5410_041599 [Solanum commersonii]|uniref:Uncharacterized protein n=1 Tax=Solanum commersonii TaxID=4109 RepID=A0A9J5XTC4_SOLCO|nr:hypothetical protein H5410_041599 [Solanum commersonii]
MNLEHPDHILEEVNKEELDMPTNMEGDEEETFEEDEWIDEEETSEDDACEWIDDEETSKRMNNNFLRLSVESVSKKKSWYCGSSSSSFDGGDRETISQWRGNILPPCPTSNDESDQEGDENDKSDKESEGDEE